jgi:hypothetical protein
MRTLWTSSRRPRGSVKSVFFLVVLIVVSVLFYLRVAKKKDWWPFTVRTSHRILHTTGVEGIRDVAEEIGALNHEQRYDKAVGVFESHSGIFQETDPEARRFAAMGFAAAADAYKGAGLRKKASYFYAVSAKIKKEQGAPAATVDELLAKATELDPTNELVQKVKFETVPAK